MNAKVNKGSTSSDDHRGPGLVNIAAGALSHLGEQIMIGMINMIIINMMTDEEEEEEDLHHRDY